MPQYEKAAENERPKKKRWSLGGLFRRKSKKDTESSSDDEAKKRGFLRRKKADRGSKDVTGLFVLQGVGRKGGSTASLEPAASLGRKRVKAKVEASRDLLESSSGEEGSYSSSLASGGGSLNRRSRSARTERYLRRRCEAWSPSPPRKTGLEQRSVSEQGMARKAPPYVPPPPPLRPPAVSQRSVSDQHLAPPLPCRPKQLPSLTNSELSVSDASSYRLSPLAERRELKKPPTPPERRSSRHSMVFPDVVDVRKRNSSNLEEALNELEAIYNSLRLGEEEYERGSRRSDSIYSSQTSLPRRRADKLADDMAYRRWNKRSQDRVDNREIVSQAGSYLLLSPTLSPPPIVPRVPNEPHVTLDDVVYRNMNHTNNTLRICDPQPPFGIPLGPVTPAAQSDYLHVSPTQRRAPLRTKVPDVVLDDLAFRNLRKDAQDTTVCLKKRKAARSLSANLSNLVLRPDGVPFEVNNNLDDAKSRSYSNIPKDLRLAQRMLDIRLMNLRNKIKDQERAARTNSSSETLNHSNRSASGTPERRTPTREPQRARYGSDGHFKYSDLHNHDRRPLLRDDWRRPPTPEKKSVSKEELRKKFFADAYRNLDRTKWPQKLTENPHHKVQQTLEAHSKPPKVEPRPERTVAFSSLQPHKTPHSVTGDFFFPKDFEVPKSGRKSPTLDELFVMYSSRTTQTSPPRPSPSPEVLPSQPEEKEPAESLCNGHAEEGSDSTGRGTPSGEEVRRILCPPEADPGEEAALLRRLEEEATATGLEMDRELRSLSLPPKGDVSSRNVADLLRELTRSLDYDFGPPPDPPKHAPDSGIA